MTAEVGVREAVRQLGRAVRTLARAVVGAARAPRTEPTDPVGPPQEWLDLVAETDPGWLARSPWADRATNHARSRRHAHKSPHPLPEPVEGPEPVESHRADPSTRSLRDLLRERKGHVPAPLPEEHRDEVAVRLEGSPEPVASSPEPVEGLAVPPKPRGRLHLVAVDKEPFDWPADPSTRSLRDLLREQKEQVLREQKEQVLREGNEYVPARLPEEHRDEVAVRLEGPLPEPVAPLPEPVEGSPVRHVNEADPSTRSLRDLLRERREQVLREQKEQVLRDRGESPRARLPEEHRDEVAVRLEGPPIELVAPPPELVEGSSRTPLRTVRGPQPATPRWPDLPPTADLDAVQPGPGLAARLWAADAPDDLTAAQRRS